MAPPLVPMETRFWNKVYKHDDGCWEWAGGRDKDGYGTINRPGSPSMKIRSHVYSWLLHFGPYHRSLLVCHSCDNPSCVRPDHLFLGTPRDNTLDMVAKGRHGSRPKERCPHGHSYADHGRIIAGAKRCGVCVEDRQTRRRIKRQLDKEEASRYGT